MTTATPTPTSNTLILPLEDQVDEDVHIVCVSCNGITIEFGAPVEAYCKKVQPFDGWLIPARDKLCKQCVKVGSCPKCSL